MHIYTQLAFFLLFPHFWFPPGFKSSWQSHFNSWKCLQYFTKLKHTAHKQKGWLATSLPKMSVISAEVVFPNKQIHLSFVVVPWGAGSSDGGQHWSLQRERLQIRLVLLWNSCKMVVIDYKHDAEQTNLKFHICCLIRFFNSHCAYVHTPGEEHDPACVSAG